MLLCYQEDLLTPHDLLAPHDLNLAKVRCSGLLTVLRHVCINKLFCSLSFLHANHFKGAVEHKQADFLQLMLRAHVSCFALCSANRPSDS